MAVVSEAQKELPQENPAWEEWGENIVLPHKQPNWPKYKKLMDVSTGLRKNNFSKSNLN